MTSEALRARLSAGVTLTLVAAAGCQRSGSGRQPEAAPELIYSNARIYTVDDVSPWAEALAVRGGRIAAVGKSADVLALRGEKTRVVDLGGRMLMPGIQDLHAHPMIAGQARFFECSFPFTLTMPEILDKVRECAARTPKGEWIRGGLWPQGLLGTKNPPHRRLLDAISKDHPIFLRDETVHGAWLNSAALARVGIDKATPDPKGGVIARDPDGQPTGILQDQATFEAMHKLPPYAPEEYQKALQWALSELNKVGVTTLKDALVDSHTLRAYADLDRAGELTMRVAASLAWKDSWSEPREKELATIAERARQKTANVNPDFAKIFLDGIPPTRTAAMLEPYLPDAAHGKDFRGELIYEPKQLRDDVTELDRQGLTVKIHATGDRAVRVALDAFEAARRANGASDRLHEVAHAELVHPDDLPRFKALDVVAEMCPILWYRTPLVDVMAKTVGEERAMHFWPTRSLVEAGALVTFGSDWPSVVPDPNPWPGLEALVTRRDPYTDSGPPLWPEQAVDLPAAVRIFTRNGARAARLDPGAGVLAPGMAADFIVLDRNIFEVPIADVSRTKVLATVVGGRDVHRDAAWTQ